MPTYKLNRDYVLRSKFGRSVAFKAGEATYIPSFLEAECVAIGGENCEKDSVKATVKKKEDDTWTYEKRQEYLFKLFDDLVKKNDAKDFAATGAPSLAVVKKQVEFNLERTELEDYWKAYKLGALEN